ncbi:hypothetical protein H8356DRAFT_1326411 [Neocallimastix lanati (nom. inval.)]|nr:hypothetical protein H8356DRAFT_1326411 [Neocallimastix sp. JGI-2020a]
MEDNIEIEINKSKIYRCTEYKTLNKCKSLIILNDKKEVLKYESLHNHLEKEIDVSISVAKHKIKEEIKKISIPMDIKPKHIFNAVSQEMRLICPEYSTIRSQIIRNINKQFPPNIKSFDDIPIESEYYKTKRNENFMIFKNTDLIIFQSPFQAYLFSNYQKNIFADKISETNKEKTQIIVNRKYKFNLWYITNNTKVFKCTEYKTVKKCKSYIILNDNNKVIKYENKHTHPGKEYDASVSIVKHKMKNEIRKTSIPFDINPKHIYNEISEEIGLIYPEYSSIKSQISRYIKKQLPPDISKFNEIPDESEYYINERDENFMIFKNSNIIIFQSLFPIPNRILSKINSFYTTSLSILNNKEQATYELLFEELKKNASKYNNNIIVTPKILHCDFEKGISNAAIKIFPNITIKYCVWHYKRSLEVQKNKLCYNETYLYKYDIQYWNL